MQLARCSLSLSAAVGKRKFLFVAARAGFLAVDGHAYVVKQTPSQLDLLCAHQVNRCEGRSRTGPRYVPLKSALSKCGEAHCHEQRNALKHGSLRSVKSHSRPGFRAFGGARPAAVHRTWPEQQTVLTSPDEAR